MGNSKNICEGFSWDSEADKQVQQSLVAGGTLAKLHGVLLKQSW